MLLGFTGFSSRGFFSIYFDATYVVVWLLPNFNLFLSNFTGFSQNLLSLTQGKEVLAKCYRVLLGFLFMYLTMFQRVFPIYFDATYAMF